ncbi:hypothetical protein Y032_0200g1690 [Ancylostoma ceylanicum]|uniref:G-protein coupled receptors family 1 profile domain-containing protein n=1 Tax=Ancylostoma ceylanicum TaxID=53326 RepID=A0A016SNG9_9BILA|nr:hypothetical protein Y032_0200g1690 [Ancylostoma ceylanicum]
MNDFQSYQFVLSFTFNTPCDVFLPRAFYIVFHMPLMYSILWIEASQIVMLFGRFLTTFSLVRREKQNKTSGKIMFLTSLFIPFMALLALYSGENFDVPQINVLNTPQTLTSRINMMFISIIILNTIGLPALITMHIYSKRKSKRAEGLRSRFQCAQEINSSLLIISLTALQIIIFFAYSSCMFYLRMTFRPSEDSLAIFRSKIIAGYLVHVHTLLLPLITMGFLWRMKQERRSTIKSMLKVKSTGAEGWANYASQLNQQWS